MKTIKLLFLGTVVLLFGTTACIDDFTIHGNRIEATEGRLTANFKEVSSEGAFDVHITQGDEYQVSLTAESNILPYIETDVYGNTLRIHIRGIHNVNNHLPMEVFITTPYLEGIKQSGSGLVTTDYFEADDFDVALSGSGSIETAIDASNVKAAISGSGRLMLSGISDDATFIISGSGKIDADALSLDYCKATISGSGNMWINVERFMEATISGSGSIYYSGNPAIEKHISGSGNVFQHN